MTMRLLANVLFLCVTATAALCEPLRTITLKDGSQIQGTLSAVESGRYVIRNPSLGEIRIKESEVVSITNTGEGSARDHAPQGGAYSGGIQGLQNELMANPDIMADIASLADDPQLMALMNDPSILSAIASSDIQSLASNPKAKQLMENPKIRRIMNKYQNGRR